MTTIRMLSERVGHTEGRIYDWTRAGRIPAPKKVVGKPQFWTEEKIPQVLAAIQKMEAMGLKKNLRKKAG